VGLTVTAALGFSSPSAAAGPEASASRTSRGTSGAAPATRPYVRVISETAEVYSGAGFGYRVIARVGKDDVLEMVERGKRGGWTRVRLETGITGWILSEQVVIFSQEGDAEVGPFRRAGRKIRAAILGPPTLLTARAGGALSAGAFGSEGLFLVRPSVHINPNVAIEAYIGPAAGRETTRGIFGLAGNIYLMPKIPFSLFMSVGTGAVFTRGKVDAIQDAAWSYLLSPGGGAMLILKKGVELRFDFRNHVLFRAETAEAIQEYSGALAFHF
jgi:hypothetical protein